MALDADTLLEKLESLYWASAQREICMLLLFYHELEKAALRDVDPQLTNPSWVAFRDLFETWTRGQGTYNIDELFESTTTKAEEHYNVSNKQRLARCLLQSSSFLDIDVLYEPSDQSFFSGMKQSICVEEGSQGSHEKNVVLRPLICNGCSRFLRSSIYYQCGSGCSQEDSLTDWVRKSISRLNKGAFSNSLQSPPVRICQSCISTMKNIDGCRIQHLTKVIHKNPSLKPSIIQQFQRHWNAVEKSSSTVAYSRKKGVKLVGKFTRKLELLKVVPGRPHPLLPAPVKHLIDRVAPAGSHFHLALQFGPLIIESGLEGINHGVLVQPRPFPKLFENENMPINLIEDTENGQQYVRQCLVVFDDAKNNGLRTLSTQDREIRVRNTLALSKRVHGGAFSGYLHPERQEEIAILDLFLLEAGRNKYRGGYTVRARRKRLYKSANNLLNMIQPNLCQEVRKYLRRMAILLLDPTIELSFNKFGNNCQKLTDRLLSGRDFEYVFPRLPAANTTNDWPRYLVSFGNRVSAEPIDIKQADSLLASFCLKSSKPDGDIVDSLYEEESRLRNRGMEEDGDLRDRTKWAESLCHSLKLSFPLDVTGMGVIWSHPRDALSIFHFHLTRASYKYLNVIDARYSQDAWTESRLKVLSHLDIFSTFTGALGSAMLEMFRDPRKIQTLTIPKARIFGTLRANEKVRILRFGKVATYIIQRYRYLHEQGSLKAIFQGILDPELVRVLGKLSQALIRAFSGSLDPISVAAAVIQTVQTFYKFGHQLATGSVANAYVWSLEEIVYNLMTTLTCEDHWLYMELQPGIIWAMQLMRKTKNTRGGVQ